MEDRYLIQLPSGSVPWKYVENREFNRSHYIDGHYVYDLRSNDPLIMRTRLEKIAKFFKREFGYDFVQFGATDFIDSNKVRPFLFAKPLYDEREVFFGGCCFRFREYKIGPPVWALQWVWIHPYMRHQNLWKTFSDFIISKNEDLKDYFIEPPLSGSMKAFIKKNRPDLCELFRL